VVAGVEDVVAALDGHLGCDKDVVGSLAEAADQPPQDAVLARVRGVRDNVAGGIGGPVVDRLADHPRFEAGQHDEQDLPPPGRQLGAQLVDHAAVTSADRLAQGGDHLPQRVGTGTALAAGYEDRVTGTTCPGRADRHRGGHQGVPVSLRLPKHHCRRDRDVVERRARQPAGGRGEDDVGTLDALAGKQVVGVVQEPAAHAVDP